MPFSDRYFVSASISPKATLTLYPRSFAASAISNLCDIKKLRWLTKISRVLFINNKSIKFTSSNPLDSY